MIDDRYFIEPAVWSVDADALKAPAAPPEFSALNAAPFVNDIGALNTRVAGLKQVGQSAPRSESLKLRETSNMRSHSLHS